jgi:hypothetical protein
MKHLVATWLVLLLAPGVLFAQARSNSSFDHFTTGFDLDGAHRVVDCETCHVAGVFQGTPTQCGSCHVTGGRIRASAKPANHPLTTEYCADCHRTTAWVPARMNHDAVFGTCMSCHNNVFNAGKPPGHLLTQSDCDACHRTTGWVPTLFNTPSGKNSTHILSTNNCDACHSAANFFVVRVDHAEVIGTCFSCHNGVTATGKGSAHPINTGNACDNCHTTTAWTPARP